MTITIWDDIRYGDISARDFPDGNGSDDDGKVSTTQAHCRTRPIVVCTKLLRFLLCLVTLGLFYAYIVATYGNWRSERLAAEARKEGGATAATSANSAPSPWRLEGIAAEAVGGSIAANPTKRFPKQPPRTQQNANPPFLLLPRAKGAPAPSQSPATLSAGFSAPQSAPSPKTSTQSAQQSSGARAPSSNGTSDGGTALANALAPLTAAGKDGGDQWSAPCELAGAETGEGTASDEPAPSCGRPAPHVPEGQEFPMDFSESETGPLAEELLGTQRAAGAEGPIPPSPVELAEAPSPANPPATLEELIETAEANCGCEAENRRARIERTVQRLTNGEDIYVPVPGEEALLRKVDFIHVGEDHRLCVNPPRSWQEDQVPLASADGLTTVLRLNSSETLGSSLFFIDRIAGEDLLVASLLFMDRNGCLSDGDVGELRTLFGPRGMYGRTISMAMRRIMRELFGWDWIIPLQPQQNFKELARTESGKNEIFEVVWDHYISCFGIGHLVPSPDEVREIRAHVEAFTLANMDKFVDGEFALFPFCFPTTEAQRELFMAFISDVPELVRERCIPTGRHDNILFKNPLFVDALSNYNSGLYAGFDGKTYGFRLRLLRAMRAVYRAGVRHFPVNERFAFEAALADYGPGSRLETVELVAVRGNHLSVNGGAVAYTFDRCPDEFRVEFAEIFLRRA
ncbi:MAG: hypothetical protein LBI39_02275 [Puniceicoccales bacterium]|jgi:hypothetical protein|nr:hypothetical protein [Puniceicoccales bacterium]